MPSGHTGGAEHPGKPPRGQRAVLVRPVPAAALRGDGLGIGPPGGDQGVRHGAPRGDRDRLSVHRVLRCRLDAGRVPGQLVLIRGAGLPGAFQPADVTRDVFGGHVLVVEHQAHVGEQRRRRGEQLAVGRGRLPQVHVAVQRVGGQRAHPLEQLGDVGQALVRRGQAGWPVRRGREQVHELLLGRDGRIPAGRGRRTAPGSLDVAGQRGRQGGGCRAEPVSRRARRQQQHRRRPRHGRQPPAREPGRDVGDRAGGGDRQHVGEQRGGDAGSGVGPGHPGEEDREGNRDRHQRRQPDHAVDRRPDGQRHAADHGEPEVRDGLVPPGSAEGGQDKRGETAEGGKRGHLQVADHLVGQREQRRHDDRGAHRPHGGRGRPRYPPGGMARGPRRGRPWQPGPKSPGGRGRERGIGHRAKPTNGDGPRECQERVSRSPTRGGRS